MLAGRHACPQGEEGRTMCLAHLSPSADGISSERVLDTLARLYPDVIAAVEAYVAAWRARFRRDGWPPPSGRGAVTA